MASARTADRFFRRPFAKQVHHRRTRRHFRTAFSFHAKRAVHSFYSSFDIRFDPIKKDKPNAFYPFISWLCGRSGVVPSCVCVADRAYILVALHSHSLSSFIPSILHLVTGRPIDHDYYPSCPFQTETTATLTTLLAITPSAVVEQTTMIIMRTMSISKRSKYSRISEARPRRDSHYHEFGSDSLSQVYKS
jgi:hypothetical protein